MSTKFFLRKFPGQRPDAILFDLDGTLVDSAPDIASALDAAMQGAGFPPPGEARTRIWIGNGSQVLVQRALTWALDCTREDVDHRLVKQVFGSFLMHYAATNGIASRLYDGVVEALQHWQQQSVALAVVTNKPLQFVHPLLSAMGIERYFALLLGGECVPEKKPSPMPLLHACERLDVEPARSFLVGDSGNDVRAARAACMPVVGVRGGYNHGGVIDDEYPDLVVNSLSELICRD